MGASSGLCSRTHGPCTPPRPAHPLPGLAHSPSQLSRPVLTAGRGVGEGTLEPHWPEVAGQWQGRGTPKGLSSTDRTWSTMGPHSHQPQSDRLVPVGKLRPRGVSWPPHTPLLVLGLFLSLGNHFSLAQNTGRSWRTAPTCGTAPPPQTHRHEEHGEEVDHGFHVEAPLGSDADGGEKGQAAESGQEQFGHERPHGPGREALAGEERWLQASQVPGAGNTQGRRGSEGSCAVHARTGGRDLRAQAERHEQRVRQLTAT